MSHKLAYFLILCFCLSMTGAAGDLYKVLVQSRADAEKLASSEVNAVLRVDGGYLVLVDENAAQIMQWSGLKSNLLATDIERNRLALDNSLGRRYIGRFEIIYEEDNLRLFRLDGDIGSFVDSDMQLSPILTENLPITYQKVMEYNPRAVEEIVGLDSLIGLASEDSLLSYTERLQAFNGLVAGTDSNHAASAWLASKFESFGYDSVVFDSFVFSAQGNQRLCRNVIAVKIGNRLPDWQVIVGAHMDAVNGSPGANDNGSGTAGVLELARVLAGIDTDLTFIFVTFDGEEWGLYGSWHYADRAYANGDHIVYMLNMDMIAHYTNNDRAKLFHGSKTAFSLLWSDLSDSLAGITATLSGTSGGSDHFPFTQYGYHATFAHEYYFSTVYHSPQDSTTYMNFDYMTRMVKASLATVYAVNLLPPPVIIISIIDGGDGQSLQVNWVPMGADLIDHFWVYWQNGSPDLDSAMVSGGESGVVVTGLSEGEEYGFFVLPYNTAGQTSVEYEIAYGTPYSIPGNVTGLAARPVYHGIELLWDNNPELDMSHYRITRDGTLLTDMIGDTIFIDGDTALGKAIHYYMVFAVDNDGNISDTTDAVQVTSKAAMMDEGRILAVNRSHTSSGLYLVDETITGEFLRDALIGYDFHYLSDTTHADEEKASLLTLYDLIDYEAVIIGGESARLDDIGASANEGGRLDTLAYYMSIGGKLIIFGRWGVLDFEVTLPYGPGSPEFAYNLFFGIEARNLTLTSSTATELFSDLIGAHSQLPSLPDMTWDSTVTAEHSWPYTDVSGIPCVSYPTLNNPELEIIYTYNSTEDRGINEGQPIAWRDPGRYVFFDVPLSFIERSQAVATLNRLLTDFGFAEAAVALYPNRVDIWADDTVMVDIYLGNLIGGYDPADIDVTTIVINDTLMPVSTEVMPSHPDFTGEVLRVSVGSADFAATYGGIFGFGNQETFSVSWSYIGQADTLILEGNLIVDGYRCGDPNTDGAIDLADAVYLINFIFRNGPYPFPYETGDANGDWGISVGDAVYLINYVFKEGPAPVCPE